MRKVNAVLADGSGEKLGKRPFPLKRFILGCVVLAIGIVVAVFIIKNAGAGLSEVNIPVGADTQNSIMSKPEEGDPSDLTAVESLFIAAGVLKDAGSFSAECAGTSTSMGVSQGIRSRRTAIGQKAFKEVVSYSAFVKMGEQRYYNGNDYLIRGSESVGSVSDVSWGSAVTPVDKDTYLSRYGYIPCEMTSYILNAESVTSGEFVSAENGLYTFHYDLNVQLAPVNLLYEMRTSAGTSNYPKFLSADMTVVMDGAWTVKTVSTSAKYEVAMLGGVTCEESMTETFTQIGGITQLPETEFFAPYFGSETTDEVEKAPDALTAITEIFGDFINGAPLNAKLTLSAPGTELDGVSALVSLGIDIENTDNITADVRLGGLDFSYQKGALYLSYGDFQGSMTVDGLTSAVGSVCKMFGVDLSGMADIDLDSLLGGMTITETDGGCVISLDADFGGLALSAAINAEKSGDSYKLTSIVANVGDYTLNAQLCEAWNVKKFVPEQCPDLLGLLDVLGDGTISFAVNVNGIEIDVQYDIKNNVLNAFAGDLVLALENETLYLQYNDVKLKLKLSDLPGVMDDLSPLLGALGLDLDLSSLPAIDIKGITDSLVVVSDGTNAKFSFELFGANINIDLANVDNRWTLAGLGGSFGGVAIDAKPAAARPFVSIDDGEYVSATALAGLLRSVLSEPINLELELSAPGTEFDGLTAMVRLNIDVANIANTTVNVRVGGLDFAYKNGMLYLSYGDFKGSIKVESLASAVDSVCSMFGVGMEMPALDFDLEALLAGIKLTETENGCVISLDTKLGDTAIGASVTAAKNGDTYALSSIVAKLGDYTLTANACDAWDVTEFIPDECPDLLGLLDILGDGTLSFAVNVNGIGIDVQYDIKNNVLNIFAGDIVLAIQDNTLYVKYNEIKLKLKLSDIPAVMDDLRPILDALGLDLDLSSLPELDVRGILDGITVESDGTTAKFSLELFGATVGVDLANIENRWTLAGIDGSFAGISIDAKPSVARPFVKIDDSDYVNGKALTGLLKSVVSEPLYLKLTLSAPGTELDGLTALVRVNLDLANIANTTVDVRLGDLDFSYRNGVLYVAYGEFKGSMTVDNLASAVNSICSMFGVNVEMPAMDFDLEALLGGIRLTETESGCVISLDTKIGDSAINASVTAVKNDGTYALSSVFVKLGDYTLTANAYDAWEVTEFIPEECPDLLGLLDVLGDGTLSFAANVNGIGIDIQYDIKNNVLNMFAGDIVLVLQDNTLYVKYNEIKLKLKLSDIPAVMDDLRPILDALGLDLDLSSLPELDVRGILDGITVESDGTNAKFSLELFGAMVVIDLANIENRWTLSGINGSFAGVSIDAKPSEARPFVSVSESEYIDSAALVATFAAPLAGLISAENFAFDVDLDIASGGTVYSVNAVVNINGGIAVNGTIGINGMNAIAFDVIYVDGIVYLTVNGADLAFKAGNIGDSSSVDIASLLGSLRGYNGTLDAVIDDLLRVINVAGNGVDFGSLVKSLSFDETAGALRTVIGGGQFGIADLDVTLCGGETFALNVSDFTVGGVGFAAGLSVRPSTEIVTAPGRDYVTDLAIRIDELNTLYLNIDSLNGVYRFRLDDLYGEYSGDTFRINYRDVYLSGNVKELGAIISALDTIVKDAQTKYAVGILAQTALETSTDGNFLKNLINSITIAANGEKGTLKIGFSIFGIDADLSVACGDAPVMTVNVSLAGKDVTASVADSEISYFDFGSVADSEYVDITTVFKDYLGEFETLAKANSWHFDISAEIELGGAKYLLAAGSGIDLVYYTADKFDIKATLILKKWDGAGYADAYNIKAAYVGGRIYFDYSNANNNSGVKTDNHLKLTLSAEAIDKCADLLPRLLEVVPQIGQLLADMKQSAGDALENLELVKYSSIIKSASYENGTFGLVINMGVILPALGDLDLTVTRNELGGLSLGIGSFAYDDGKGTTFALKNVAVSVAAQTEDAGNANIGEFSTDGYINLDSLYELLSAFTITADNNSFKLSGTAKVSLVVSVEIGLDLVVDVDKDGYVYVSFRLYREKLGLLDFAGAAFNDYGGYSYLNYNGKTNTVRVIRNSYQKEKWYSTSVKLNTEYGSKKPEYDTGDMPAAQFTENMIDYILQMVNFKGWINNQITGAINKEGSGAVYGIEDVLKSYTYTDGKFGIVADLTPMDSNLGQLSLDIYHDADYSLTKLTASMGLLKDWCTITVNDLDLLPPESGLAITRVENNLIW